MRETETRDTVLSNPKWPAIRARWLFDERRVPCTPDATPLAATQQFGVIPQSEYEELTGNRVTKAADTSGFKSVHPGNFIISLRTFQGGIELAKAEGGISPAYTVMQSSHLVLSGYFRYLLKSDPFISLLQTVVTGIRDGKAVRFNDFAQIPLPVPAEHTQRRIADFLDRETERIDGLIEKKERLIALLEEKRAALITRAVTKGLDPTVPMKDSGVEWIGEIPEHWEVAPLKNVTIGGRDAIRAGPFGSQMKGADFVPSSAFRVYNQDTVISSDFQNSAFVNEAKFSELQAFRVREGDLLVTSRGTIGRVAIVPASAGPGVIHPCVIRVRLRQSSLVSRFFEHLLTNSDSVVEQLRAASNATTIDVVYSTTLARVLIPLPPPEEQEAIVRFAGEENDKVDHLIGLTRRSIALLREGRSALITAAVTGQINIDEYEAAQGALRSQV